MIFISTSVMQSYFFHPVRQALEEGPRILNWWHPEAGLTLDMPEIHSARSIRVGQSHRKVLSEFPAGDGFL